MKALHMNKKILLLLLVLIVTGCRVDPEKNIYKVKIGNQPFCIERAYFKLGDDPNSSSILLSMMRPDMRPISHNERENIGDDAFWKNKTSLLLDETPDTDNLDNSYALEALKLRAQNYAPTEEKKYGLIVAKNSTKSQAWMYFWEPNEDSNNPKAAHIRCLIAGSKNPQCTHKFYHSGYSFNLNYKIDNLEDWKTIKQQTIDFVDSKKCE